MDVATLFDKPKPPKSVEFTGPCGVFPPCLHGIRDEVRAEWADRRYGTDELISEVSRRFRARLPKPDAQPPPPMED